MSILTETGIMTDILQRYKDLPCLWNHKHVYYHNKVKRLECYQELIEKYRLWKPEAYIHDLKKRIEHMRTTYKREHVKVVKSKMSGGREYKPTLWYYNLLKFLDDEKEDQSTCAEEEEKDDTEEEYLQIEGHSDSPPPIKEEHSNIIFLTDHDNTEDKYSISTEQHSRNNLETSSTAADSPPSKKKRKSNIIYITEDDRTEEPYLISTSQPSRDSLQPSSSSQSYGRLISLQLSELQPMQRFIAEKLIADVVFYGRLGKLEPDTTLNIKNNEY